MEDYAKSNYYFIRLILKWKVQFGIISLISLIGAFVFSSEFFIKPKYKSFAIVYPLNITPYGKESPTEQMMQLLESSDIRDAVIRKFNLISRYDIDSTKKTWKASLIGVYESNVSISKTQYESIKIEAIDTDPQIACDIVNEILKELNLKARNLQRSKTKEVLNLANWVLDLKKHQLDSLYSNLLELRVKYQILDYGVQSKEVIKGYVKAISGGKGSGSLREMDVMLRNLEEKGGEYYQEWSFYNSTLNAYNIAIIDRENLVKELTKELTYTNEVSSPFASDKKTYPIKWLILVISIASANLFLFVTILMIDVRKKVIE